MYERSHIHVKVEPHSTFTFKRVLSYISSILFTHVSTGVRITRQWKSTLRTAGYDDLCQAPLVFSTGSTEYLTSLFCLV